MNKELEVTRNVVLWNVESRRDLKCFVRRSEAKRASLRALARDSALSSGEEILSLSRYAFWLVGRSVGASLRRGAGPMGMRCRQGAFHCVRAISPRRKTIRKTVRKTIRKKKRGKKDIEKKRNSAYVTDVTHEYTL